VAETILADLEVEPTWEVVLSLDPRRRYALSDVELDQACEALADFADIKSPYMVGRSPAVASLAAGAAQRCGLVDADVSLLRRGGLLHDIGRVGVSAGIWGMARATTAALRVRCSHPPRASSPPPTRIGP